MTPQQPSDGPSRGPGTVLPPEAMETHQRNHLEASACRGSGFRLIFRACCPMRSLVQSDEESHGTDPERGGTAVVVLRAVSPAAPRRRRLRAGNRGGAGGLPPRLRVRHLQRHPGPAQGLRRTDPAPDGEHQVAPAGPSVLRGGDPRKPGPAGPLLPVPGGARGAGPARGPAGGSGGVPRRTALRPLSGGADPQVERRHSAALAGGRLAVGVAAYAHRHPESPSFQHDVEVLLSKERSGANFAITQVYFHPATTSGWSRRPARPESRSRSSRASSRSPAWPGCAGCPS